MLRAALCSARLFSLLSLVVVTICLSSRSLSFPLGLHHSADASQHGYHSEGHSEHKKSKDKKNKDKGKKDKKKDKKKKKSGFGVRHPSSSSSPSIIFIIFIS